MFVSTVELISLVASNSNFVFCFCNLIIVILLVSNSKPGPDFDEDNVGNYNRQEIQGLVHVIEVPSAQVVLISDNKRNDNDNNKNEDGDDDELRRRVEEFIDKVNKGWRAEKLTSSHLVNDENLQPSGFCRIHAI